VPKMFTYSYRVSFHLSAK